MGYKYSFIDNVTYGTDDINAAISRLTTKGVTVYPTDENLINAMNGVISAVATPGTDFNQYSCLVSIDNESIKISSGTAFFEDGVTMVIDDNGILLPLEYNAYVYLYRDINMNNCYPCVSNELPENYYVLLAYIDEAGNIQDKREYAVSKLAPNSQIKASSFFTDIEYVTYTPTDIPLATFNVGYSTFSHVAFRQPNFPIYGYVSLPNEDFSEYVPFHDSSSIRFKKNGTFLELYINPHGDIHKVGNLEVITF